MGYLTPVRGGVRKLMGRQKSSHCRNKMSLKKNFDNIKGTELILVDGEEELIPLDVRPYDVYKGVYGITHDDRPFLTGNMKVLSKVGMGGSTERVGGLLKRLDQYSGMCSPDGFYMLALIICETGKMTKMLEKEIHQLLRKRKLDYKTVFSGRQRHEFFLAKVSQIHDAFIDVYKKHHAYTRLWFPSILKNEKERHAKAMQRYAKQRKDD